MHDRPCTACSGFGRVPGMTIDVASGEVIRSGVITCPRCGGTGRVRATGVERLRAWFAARAQRGMA